MIAKQSGVCGFATWLGSAALALRPWWLEYARRELAPGLRGWVCRLALNN